MNWKFISFFVGSGFIKYATNVDEFLIHEYISSSDRSQFPDWCHFIDTISRTKCRLQIFLAAGFDF